MPSMTATEAVSCGMGRRAAKVSHVNVRCWIESAEWFSLGRVKGILTLADDVER